MKNEFRKFIPRIVKFLIPYSVFAVFTVVVFYRSGEIFAVKKVLEAQMTERKNVIYGPSYSNIPHYYKFAATEIIQPTVLILGSSRVLQFRSGFFNDSVSFYTAGGVFRRISQLRAFLESLPDEKLPHAIILGIDPWWFCTGYDEPANKFDLDYKKYFWTENIKSLNQWHQFYADVLKGKISISKFFSLQPDSDAYFTGISGIMLHQGFRKDGSRSYGSEKEIKKHVNYRLQGAIDSVRRGQGIMEWSDSSNAINRNALKEMRLLLRYCSKHKITVTGFIPPVYSTVLTEMQKHPEHYQHFFNLTNVLYPIFRDYKYYLYDFSFVSSFGGRDGEMIDAIHGSEKINLRLYLQLLRKEGYLNQYSDSTHLKEILSSHKNRYEIFGNN